MRISTSTVNNLATNSMGNAYDNYADIIRKISSGKNFTKVSDDVVGATKVLKMSDNIGKIQEYQSNIKAAINEMDMAYDVLNDVSDELNSVNTLIIEAASTTTNKADARAIAAEIKQRVATIADKMNTKYLDNYIFSGTYIEEQTYLPTEDGNYEYQGSSVQAGDRNLTIAANTTFSYNLTGEQIMGNPDSPDYFFKNMKELDDLLNADYLDYTAIREKMANVQDVQKNITYCNGIISAKVASLESTKDINDSLLANLQGDKADIEEIDITKAATDLASAKNSLQATYAMGSTVLGSVSLLDYL